MWRGGGLLARNKNVQTQSASHWPSEEENIVRVSERGWNSERGKTACEAVNAEENQRPWSLRMRSSCTPDSHYILGRKMGWGGGGVPALKVHIYI